MSAIPSPNGNGSSPPATIPYSPVPGQREAAAERRKTFPYRFPRDARLLGGKFTVAENARRLLRFFYFERRLTQALGAWTLSVPEFEVKLETGRHIFWHADAARQLRERLSEQEMRLKDIDAFRDADVDRFIEEMLSAKDAPELLAGVHQVIGGALATAYRHHIDDTDPVADVPTIRCLRRILTDYEPMLDWADHALAAYVEGGVEESQLAAWRWHLQRLLASIGGVTGGDARAEAPTPLRSAAKPFERGTVPLRDVRFDTFGGREQTLRVADLAGTKQAIQFEDERAHVAATSNDNDHPGSLERNRERDNTDSDEQPHDPARSTAEHQVLHCFDHGSFFFTPL